MLETIPNWYYVVALVMWVVWSRIEEKRNPFFDTPAVFLFLLLSLLWPISLPVVIYEEFNNVK